MGDITSNFETAWSVIELLLPVGIFCLTLVILVSFGHKKYIRHRFEQSGLFFGMFAVFGATIGMFMGASQSAIVSSLLPPIITLISGYLAYLGSRSLPAEIKMLMPGGIFILAVSLLYSAFYSTMWHNP